MTFQNCVIECLQHKELMQEFDRLTGSKVTDIFYDNRPPIVRMIDEATGFDKAMSLERSKELLAFLWFIYDCIWMRLPQECRSLI